MWQPSIFPVFTIALAGTARQSIAVGDDFEYEAPAGRKTLWLEVRSTGGKWQVQGSVVVR